MNTSSDFAAAQVFVTGKVQGVGFRDFTWHCGQKLHLLGTVRNLADGRVTLEIEGMKSELKRLIEMLRKGPPRSEVTGIDVSWQAPSGRFSDFSISY